VVISKQDKEIKLQKEPEQSPKRKFELENKRTSLRSSASPEAGHRNENS
jgi:hypothetical protein